jgi:hypothetical protein
MVMAVKFIKNNLATISKLGVGVRLPSTGHGFVAPGSVRAVFA